MSYQPLKVSLLEVCGVGHSLEAMRLPFENRGNTPQMELAGKLIKAGDDHGKFTRGINAYIKIECQVGWLIEYEQHEIGIVRLSSSSSMHNELKGLRGAELAEQKQADLVEKVYTIQDVASYQALRNIYKSRRKHKHPDWQIFCDFIEELPYFEELIFPEFANV